MSLFPQGKEMIQQIAMLQPYHRLAPNKRQYAEEIRCIVFVKSCETIALTFDFSLFPSAGPGGDTAETNAPAVPSTGTEQAAVGQGDQAQQPLQQAAVAAAASGPVPQTGEWTLGYKGGVRYPRP